MCLKKTAKTTQFDEVRKGSRRIRLKDRTKSGDGERVCVDAGGEITQLVKWLRRRADPTSDRAKAFRWSLDLVG